jgi:hypothetical protein
MATYVGSPPIHGPLPQFPLACEVPTVDLRQRSFYGKSELALLLILRNRIQTTHSTRNGMQRVAACNAQLYRCFAKPKRQPFRSWLGIPHARGDHGNCPWMGSDPA